MTEWLTRLMEGWTYGLPLWLQVLAGLIPAFAIAALVARFFGIKVGAYALSALLVCVAFMTALQSAKQEGYAVRKKENDRDNDKFLKDYKEVRDASEHLADSDLDGRNRRWLRD